MRARRGRPGGAGSGCAPAFPGPEAQGQGPRLSVPVRARRQLCVGTKVIELLTRQVFVEDPLPATAGLRGEQNQAPALVQLPFQCVQGAGSRPVNSYVQVETNAVKQNKGIESGRCCFKWPDKRHCFSQKL